MEDDVTRILTAIEQGEAAETGDLLPLLYNELKSLAAAKLSRETPGQTLQATALVHEAYLRLGDASKSWDSRGHFFAAAAEAMRRILIDRARQKKTLKRGGDRKREYLQDIEIQAGSGDIDLIALDDALTKLEEKSPLKAKLVKLRFFAGLTVPQAAKALDVSESTAEKYWTYAKSWLRVEMDENHQ